MTVLYTIGHSNHSITYFVGLLQQHQIDVLCDVRSQPYSKYHPQFNYQALKLTLKTYDIGYVFLGRELGGRSTEQSCYLEGQLQYDLLAKTHLFQRGITRLMTGISSYQVALMCAEKDPLDCHRMVLICYHLHIPDLQIKHIKAQGELETQNEAEQRLLRNLKIDKKLPSCEQIELAYQKQSRKIAYKSTSHIREANEQEYILPNEIDLTSATDLF